MKIKILTSGLFLTLALASAQTTVPNATNQPATPQNAPIIKTGLQTVYTVSDLVGNTAVKIAASSNYQVSIVFPARIQSVGVNASKQSAVMTTIDEYDGRVLYVDVLKPGGTASLNVRLLTAADQLTEQTGEEPNPAAFGGNDLAKTDNDPLILKMIVDLTDKDYGVLAYTVKKDQPKPVVTPVTPTPAPVAQVQAATPAPVVQPKVIAPVKPTSFKGRNNSGMSLTVSLTDGAKNQENQALSYTLEVPASTSTFVLDTTLTTLRINNEGSKELVIPGGQFGIAPGSPVTGRLEIPKKLLQQAGAKVLMFTVLEKDPQGQEKRRYIGVLLK